MIDVDDSTNNLAEKLIEVAAIKFGEFILASGKKSNVYVDIKIASTYPDVLRAIVKTMVEKLKGLDFDKIACIELGGVPLAVALSLELNKPYVILRKQKKDYGVKADYVGEIKENEKFIVVEDVTTTGNSALSVVERLKNHKADVVGLLVVVDREEGAKNKFDVFIPLLTLSQLLEFDKLGR